MKTLYKIFIAVSILTFVFCTQCSSPQNITLDILSREQDPADSNNYIVHNKKVTLPADEVAIILCDVWNNSSDRINEMVAEMNKVVKAARDKGVFIIHAPAECMEYYKDTPQRKLAQDAPYAEPPNEIKRRVEDPAIEPPLPGTFGHLGHRIDTKKASTKISKPSNTWTKENDLIEIELGDAVSDDGQEIYNLLEQRGIDNVIIMGFATDICMVRRSYGIRQMVYNEKNIILCRDLTDISSQRTGQHSDDLQLIIEHIEKYWCPSITSESLTGKPPYKS
ncbi:hypothetical protein ACFL50_04810 [Candidatus Latescibacterota bacterium]